MRAVHIEALQLGGIEKLSTPCRIIISRPKLMSNGLVNNNKEIRVYLNVAGLGLLIAGESMTAMTDASVNFLTITGANKEKLKFQAIPGGEIRFNIKCSKIDGSFFIATE